MLLSCRQILCSVRSIGLMMPAEYYDCIRTVSVALKPCLTRANGLQIIRTTLSQKIRLYEHYPRTQDCTNNSMPEYKTLRTVLC